MAKKQLDMDVFGRYTYYYDDSDGNYYYIDSGSGNYSETNWTYKKVTDTATLTKLKSEFPYGSDEVQADINPKLNDKRINISDFFGMTTEHSGPMPASHIRFPDDLRIGENEDYVMFSFYDYKPPFQRNRVPGADVLNQDIRQYNQTGYSSEFFQADKSVYPQIVMYMPQDIQDAFKATWQGKKFGSVTAGILASAGQSGVAEKVKGLVKTGEAAINRAGVNAAAELISGLAKSLTGDSISAGDIFGGISGVARNPNMELLFQNMNVRTFDLSFKMAPYSQEDADSMEAIISIFKRAMLPQYALNGSPVFGQKDNKAIEGAFIKVPKVCAVNFMRGGSPNRYLPKYKMCAITDVNVNYTPDGTYAAFQTGSPVATEIKISFMETKLVFSEDVIDRGF